LTRHLGLWVLRLTTVSAFLFIFEAYGGFQLWLGLRQRAVVVSFGWFRPTSRFGAVRVWQLDGDLRHEGPVAQAVSSARYPLDFGDVRGSVASTGDSET